VLLSIFILRQTHMRPISDVSDLVQQPLRPIRAQACIGTSDTIALSINEPRLEQSEVLRHRKERVGKFGGKGLELSGPLRRRRYFSFSADEPMTIGLDRARAWLTIDQVRRLAVELEAAGPARCEERTTISFADADETLIHRKRDNFETSRPELAQKAYLLRCQFHSHSSIAGLQRKGEIAETTRRKRRRPKAPSTRPGTSRPN
jgi:hypothetical protein